MPRRWQQIGCRFVVGLLILAVIFVQPKPAEAQIVDGSEGYAISCGVFWPTTGEFSTVHFPGTNGWSATYRFTLTQSQIDALRCIGELVEIDFVLNGVEVSREWEDYSISSDLNGAIHDVAASDLSANQTPAVTRIYTNTLQANREYYATVSWFDTPLRPSEGDPAVAVQWVPSRWAASLPELTLCNLYRNITWPGDAWCIFGKTRVFLSRGVFGGLIPFNGIKYYRYTPTSTSVVTGILGQYSEPVTPSNPHLSALPSSSLSRQMFLRGDSAVFAKDTLGNGGWTQETDPGSINKIAVGGGVQLVLNACNAVYARTTIGSSGWVQETPCGGATQIAVSSTGVQMLIDACSAVWAKTGIGYGGWTQEVGCGNATAIAVGGNTQMFIRGDAAVFAKNTIGEGGWVEQVGPGNANAIAADNTGIIAFIRGDAAVFAKRGLYSPWQMQVGPGNAGAIAAGGGVLMFLRGDSAVFAKTNIGIDGGWTQETAPGTANLIDVGDNGRQMIRTGDNAIWAKDGIGYGGWSQQVGGGNANAIAVS